MLSTIMHEMVSVRKVHEGREILCADGIFDHHRLIPNNLCAHEGHAITYIYICVCVYRFKVSTVRGYPPPHGMGLTMEGRGHTLVVRVCVDIANCT